MYNYERDPYAEAHKRGPGWAFFSLWVFAGIAGAGFGSTLASAAEEALPMEGVLYAIRLAIGGALFGAVAGVAQGLVLLRYFKLAGFSEWVLATAIGWSFRSVISILLTDAVLLLFAGFTSLYREAPSPETYNTQSLIGNCVAMLAVLVTGGIAGIPLGLAQSLVLRRRVRYSTLWVPMNITVSAITLFIAVFITKDVAGDIVSIAIRIALTGYLLLNLLKYPDTQAKWILPWRQEQPANLPTEIEPQSSPEALLEASRATKR